MMGQGYNYKADIWSIGILICEMMGGFTPFGGNNSSGGNVSLLDEMRSGNINLPKNFSSITRDIIKCILVVDPNLRFDI
jgi:serine/threonine protein kinase